MGKLATVMWIAVSFTILAQGYLNLCYARSILGKGIDHETNFSGPPKVIVPLVPLGSGFWSFDICVPNVLSRSGQPSMDGFRWLKDHGWKSVINLTGSHDIKWWGFKELSFNYLSLPIKDNSVPTEKQVQKFLEFVTSSYNQPAHVYCHAGIGRTGVMVVLYRYMVQGWPMEIAILESRFRGNGMNNFQVNWLRTWAKTHKPGSFSNKILSVLTNK